VDYRPFTKRLLSVCVLAALTGLGACSKKDDSVAKQPGQALASVDGEEITVMQLNEELQRANIQPAQQDAAKKQLLEALIDRQILEAHAKKENVDRDPKVVQAVERAKSMILAQAYLAKHTGNGTRPGRTEVEDYFNKHPEFFSNRKLFNMNQVAIQARDFNDEVKAAADNAKSLDELAAWLDNRKVKYGRAQLARAGTDMPPEMLSKLNSMERGKIFIVKEADRANFMAISDVKDAPVALDAAAPQIEQFLFAQRNKEAAEAEIKRLRATAKVEYLNGATAADPGNLAKGNQVADRGVAGLK
jgi:EpsD family peptidyl-prolyl cis-trans isomerase